MQQCKDDANEDQCIPFEIKNNIKRIKMKRGLYVKVVMFCQKYLIFTDSNKNKNEAKFKF